MKGLMTMKLGHLMMFAAMIGCGAVFAKTEITPPILTASPYTGSVQEATLPESPNWTVAFKERGEHVGVYDIFLRLTDPKNFAWAGSDEPMIAVPFEITQAANEWTVAPAITGWTFGETAHEPTAMAKFGGVRPVVYSGTTTSGATVANAAAVSEAGSYTATFDVAGSADYTALHQTVNFTVAKKSAEGADFVVTVGENPKYDGTVKTIAVASVKFEGVDIPYSVAGNKQTNAGTYQLGVTATGNYSGAKTVEWKILQRELSLVTVVAIPDQTETGSAICPTVTVIDGTPSIVTADDFTVSYANNTAPGTATVILTGRRNYTGTKSVTFKINAKSEEKATLTAEAGWKLLKATGTYFAQVKVKCTDGYAAGISNLRFAFADRKDGAGKALAQLWNTTGRSAVSATTAYRGTTYRIVPLSAASITGINVPATYGISSLSASTIPVVERVIELYVPKRDLPSHLGEYTACILWDSQGKTYLAPVSNTSAK